MIYFVICFFFLSGGGRAEKLIRFEVCQNVVIINYESTVFSISITCKSKFFDIDLKEVILKL